MNAYSRLRYHWDGTKISSGLPGEYEKQFDDLLQKARARDGEKQKLEFDEWPTVGEPFSWRPLSAEKAFRSFPVQKVVLVCLLLSGAIASALLTSEATNFLAGELWAGDGNAIAKRIRDRL